MSLVFRNALMPSENQQVLRLRLVYLMRRFLFVTLAAGLLSSCSGSNVVKVTCDFSFGDDPNNDVTEEYTIDPRSRFALRKSEGDKISLPLEVTESHFIITDDSYDSMKEILIIDRKDSTQAFNRSEKLKNGVWVKANYPKELSTVLKSCSESD